jgi:hypothetical protein
VETKSRSKRSTKADKRGMSYDQIRRTLFGRAALIAYVTLGHFSGRNLVRSFIEDCPSRS